MTLPVSERIAVAKEDCLTVLKERLSRLKTLAERIVGIETADKLTDPQIVAKVKEHYGIDR